MQACDLDLKVMPQHGDGAKKNLSPINTTMPANNKIYQSDLIIQLCLTFIYENSKCMDRTKKACPVAGMVLS